MPPLERYQYYPINSSHAGLKINTEKPKAPFIGLTKDSVDTLGLDYSEHYIHCLGITISGNESDHYDLNYKQRRLSMKNLLKPEHAQTLSKR